MDSFDYLIIFSSDFFNEEVKSYIIQKIRDAGLAVEREDLKDSTLLSVGASFEVLGAKAEEISMYKCKKETGKMREFDLEFFKEFSGSDDKETFFTPAERSLLVHSYLLDIEVDKSYFQNVGIKIPSVPSLLKCCLHSKPQIIESACPLHNKAAKDKLWDKLKSNPFKSPVHEIQNYFGEGIAFYFGWMREFTLSLIIPSMFGLFLYFFKPEGKTVDNNYFLPLYAVGIVFWAIVFLTIWRRRESEYSYTWHSHNCNEYKEEIRPEFFGHMQVNAITNKTEKVYPQWKRRCRYFVSFILTLPPLCVAVAAMICSLNLNGYILNKRSPVYFSILAQFSEEGQLFHGDNPYFGWLIPTVGHSIIINTLNTLYRSVARYCTDMENHKTDHQWRNSLIVKRVLFEAFDCFLPLFYIAFYQLNIVALRREIVGLFWADEIRRLVTETIIPYTTEKGHAWKLQREYARRKKTDGTKTVISQAVHDSLLEEYDQFDDYLEMVIQFGYVTLFAPAFPLASIVTILFLFIEARSDLFKLLFIYRKPEALRCSGIGVWYVVMYVMMIVSMLTNCLIIGFSSEQLAEWCPHMYEIHADGDQYIKEGYGRYIVAIVFGCEHFLVLTAVLFHYFVAKRPKWVRLSIEKDEHEMAEQVKLFETIVALQKKANTKS